MRGIANIRAASKSRLGLPGANHYHQVMMVLLKFTLAVASGFAMWALL